MSNKSNINNRSSVNLLPTYFQTEKNKNFLTSTIDELYKVPVLQRIDGYVGSKLTPTYNPNKDVYINDRDLTSFRQKYQFQPALTIKNEDQVVTQAFGIDDLVNQLSFYGAKTDNLSRIFSPKVNSYHPHIDWDKFVNFREYYWLPTGPETITITGLQKETVSTYSVTDSANGAYFVFTPDGLTDNPLLTFYKDVTYVINVNTKSKFYLKRTNALGAESALSEAEGVFGNGTSQIIFTVLETLPGTIYYASEDTEQVIGSILIRSITENSSIDVESEIVGKINYKTAPTVNSPNGVELINGMRINFAGNVTPEYYRNREFIVEGVGNSIVLVDYATLQTPENLATLYDDDFDTNPFDDYPFDNFKNLPLVPEYVTINRASRDLNPWTRYNRWFHIDVINVSAQENGIIPVIPLNSRAKRPIVEFEANMQLYNFGNNALTPIDLMDLETADAFSTIEGATSYTVDGVALSPGQRIVFNVDADPMVKGKVFEVQYALINGQNKINLVEVTAPVFGNTVVVMQGDNEQGTEWYHNGSYWVESQQRTRLNQAPLFDLFDGNGNSYSDKTYYDSIFSGNKIFGYAIGTGTADPVLGFPLVYKNVGIEGSFLFQNYFNTDSLSLLGTEVVNTISTSETFIKRYPTLITSVLENIWVEGVPYDIPVQQISVATTTTDEIPVIVYDNSGLIADLTVDVFANSSKMILDQDYTLVIKNAVLTVVLSNRFTVDTTVLLNCYSLTTPNSLGVYEAPINLTNNPLNGSIPQFTLAEISDHVETMTQRDPAFIGVFPGVSNLKSLPNITKYGTRIITNNNPLSFAQLYLTDVKNNLIDSTRSAAFDYYQFRLNLMKFISQGNESLTSAEVVDQALESIIVNKNGSFPYALSDMVGYGTNNISRTYTVTDSRNVIYPLSSTFNSNELSTRSVLVYLNDEQLLLGRDYQFDNIDPNVEILTTLAKGDTLVIKDYVTTVGSYVPPTPSKLGLYPKYEPSIYIDNSYATKSVVIVEGHDGSRSVAYTSVADFENNNIDFRDLALLEYEKRVFNNIKTTYDPGLININDILPGVFRDNDYTYEEISDLIYGDFLKWTSTYNIDYQTNNTLNIENYKTYNYSQAKDTMFNSTIPGNWRGIYFYYFDTDRPDTAPWEMLGFSIKPSWWDNEYGPAPYTLGNLNLWQDLELGLIRQGDRAGIDPVYARPGLSGIIPVDDSGNIVDIRDWGPIAENENIDGIDENWKFGDCGPGETAWKRSSLWPYAVQIILALAKPADYAAKMFDPARLVKDATGQYRYGPDSLFLNPSTVYLNGDTDSNGNTILSSGYSVLVIEYGKKKAVNYLTGLKQNLSGVDFNLFYKAGGFLSKDKLEIIIDSVNPSSASPGAILPNEDYTLLFNTSNPVRSASASGIIVEKKNGKFLLRGYDRQNPFFLVNLPIHRASDTQITVGGKSAPYFVWRENTLYTAGQYVKYGNAFYTAATTANSGTTFEPINFIKLRQLPVIGGASVLITKEFSKKITQIPYGNQYSTLQEVYDIIVGYGKYLENLGFIFDDYNSDIGQVINWSFSGKEFLYWTTQTWAPGTVITLSPFSNKLQYKFTSAVVDNVLDTFYEYTLQKADGKPFPYQKFNLSRKDGLCTITTDNTVDGLFFARLNLVQKEHAIVLNNTSMFGDIIYDIETGYRQARMQLSGFITGDWDGDFLSPGFVFDEAVISDWQAYTDYRIADVVKYSGKYYSANNSLSGVAEFNFSDWTLLGEAPVAELLPNFEYKINQFEDFYSLDIDNFDVGQQKMAQHLIGYTPRPYLTNIILDPIAQYKFYQGFIKEKGTANAIAKLTKASVNNLAGKIEFNEEWALRVGSYGNYTSYNEVEFPLREADFRENTQVVKFVDSTTAEANSVISYILPKDVSIKPDNYNSNYVFDTELSTYDDNNLILPTAGYVKLDDITATAYNRTTLLDVSNVSALKDGDTIWMGFTSNGSWDVLRYTKQLPNVIASTVDSPSSTLTFTTDIFHTLNIGDIVTVVGLNNGTDGIYEIKDIPSKTQFSVETLLTSASLATTVALLFKFISVRANQFDDIDNLDVAIDFKYDDMVWADRGNGVSESSKWTVYRKINNYSTSTQLSSGVNVAGQEYGTAIATQDGATLILTSAPNYYSATNGYGRVFAFGYIDQQTYPVANYTVHNITYKTVPNQFGYSLVYDEGYDIVVAGAPLVNLLQVSYINRGTNSETFLLENIAGTTSTARYASTIYLAKSEFNTNSKNLLVASPGEGQVYVHNLFANITTNTSVATLTTGTSINLTTSTTADYEIVGNSNGSKVAISVPVADDNQGAVYIYNYNGSVYSLAQTLAIPSSVLSDGKFGHALAMTDDASYLFVSSLTVPDEVKGPGKVFVYTLNSSGQYEYNQTIHNPLYNPTLYFGNKIKVNESGTELVISSTGRQISDVTFDTDTTSFDGMSTYIVDYIENSGSVYKFERLNELFIYAQELFDKNAVDSVNGYITGYGNSIAINGSSIFIGAYTARTNIGSTYQYKKIDATSNSWSAYRVESDLIDLTKIRRAITIDSVAEEVVDYIEIFDPLKGRISGLADQEIRYKTAFDPAVYSVGTQSVVVDTKKSWIEDHVGELWWDLSTAKYVWYEQGDVDYRKNTWGKLFPGASIDVYEWVQSEYLPSQWSALADTSDGLTQNISGQPKYPDNSVVSVKQYFNPLTGQSTNIYYFWVKNSVLIPSDVLGRRMSARQVSSLIFDPAANGVKFLSIIAPNAVSVTNVKTTLRSNDIYLNIAKDEINSTVNKHTEWVLLGEGNPSDEPTPMLNKKLIDSLVGRDSLGNLVPDPSLSDREKYGILIRPRQSMFVNRTAALRNAVDYANGVMSQFLISDIADFRLLNSKEEIPSVYSREYDRIVESYEDLESIITIDLVTAELTCGITNGKVSSVQIVNSGTGYAALVPVELDIYGTPTAWAGPTVKVVGDVSGVVIETTINSAGNITTSTIVNAGSGLLEAPSLEVRPYTVVVQVDSNSNNRWASYELDNNKWYKIHTQSYNTTQYWQYVNWTSANYDQLKPLAATVAETYQLETLSTAIGDYVRVNNQGNGRYIVLQRVAANGTFDNDYDLVLSENGTISLNENLWNTVNNNYNFDYYFTFDQTLYDQTPERELVNILNALKDDIFVGSLRVYWNKLFFASVKYAMTEQKFLDWAFKTSFINVRNIAGELVQSPVYKFANSSYYEDYIKEVKPYHTKIRNYQVNYSLTDPTRTYTTDFDLPAYYDQETGKFIAVEFDSNLLNTYPWKAWNDNHSLHVESIIVETTGSGYTSVPLVQIIAAPGDPGTGATAEAYITLGKVVRIDVTNPGSGYLTTPTVLISGGGSTSLTPARAYPVMGNGKVRSNSVEIKFDRVSAVKELTTSTAVDEFICNGSDNEFPLSWAAENKKSNITLTLNGIRVLATDYAIETYKELTNDYQKLYSKLVLNEVPATSSTITIVYKKNINLYHAVDRIYDYYSPTVGMPGIDPAQLMNGTEYPGAQIGGLPFDYSTNWDITPFGESLYGDDSLSYTTATVVSTALTGTNTLVLSNVGSIVPGLRINTVALTTTTINENKFDASIVTVISVNTGSSSVTFSTVTIDTIVSGTVQIEFWDFNLTPGVLDTILDGGDLSYTNATGVNPEDILVDGDKFISPYVSYGPEELIRGELHESIGINVYTRSGGGAPVISQRYEEITQTTETTTFRLMMLPASNDAVMVSFRNEVLEYNVDYTIDYVAQTLTVNTQTQTGFVGITIVGVGGDEFITSDSKTVSNTSTVSVDVGIGAVSVYATLNGVELTSSQYTIVNGSLVVTGLIVGNTYTLQAWSFFSSTYSAVREENFTNSGGDTSYVLTTVPGDTWSANSQAIVEIDARILTAPDTTYYSVNYGDTVFLVDPYDTYAPNTFSISEIEVYVNGLKLRNNIDFVLDGPSNSVKFKPNFLQTGDVMAVTNWTFADYYFTGSDIHIKASANYQTGDTLKVITFTDATDSLIRTEVFRARSSRRYPLSRPVLNSRYLWVSVGGKSLINGVDYTLDEETTTVVLRSTYPYVPGEMVNIITMIDNVNNLSIAYRAFTDMLNRTQFKRLSGGNTTQLAEPLYNTSTIIVVEDTSGLAIPVPSAKRLGVVLVGRERIEYRYMTGNTLSGLTRGTLGTGAGDIYPAGTQVIDQSMAQNLPYAETNYQQIITATTATSYTIGGILLTTATAVDQFLVYYGGIQLRKAGMYVQNTDISYDNTPSNIIGTVSTSTSLPATKIIGTAYLVTATNQVWTYVDSALTTAIKGYIYSGLDYMPPEFTINNVISASTATLVLNLTTVTSGVNISLIQRVATNNFYATTGTSLIDDTGIIANFLRDQPMPIPDKYYYGTA